MRLTVRLEVALRGRFLTLCEDMLVHHRRINVDLVLVLVSVVLVTLCMPRVGLMALSKHALLGLEIDGISLRLLQGPSNGASLARSGQGTNLIHFIVDREGARRTNLEAVDSRRACVQFAERGWSCNGDYGQQSRGQHQADRKVEMQHLDNFLLAEKLKLESGRNGKR